LDDQAIVGMTRAGPAEAGVHPKIVSERLGQSTIAITLDTYSHVLPDMQRDAAAAFDQILTRS
jgi:integrase